MASDQSMASNQTMGVYGIWDDSIPNQSPKLVIAAIVCLAISTIVVAVRFGWRWAHQMRGWDDAMALCAYIILVLTTVLEIIAAAHGFGKPARYLGAALPTAFEYFFLYQIFYKLLGGFTKLTFCFLYLRIFPQRWFRWTTIIIAFISGAGSLAFAIGTIFQCTPIEKVWNIHMVGSCRGEYAFLFGHAAFNTFMDIVIFVLPIPMIRSLKMASGQKSGLVSVFCLGAFVISASIVRMILLRSSTSAADPTWSSVDALMWTGIEANTSVICCCLPVLRAPLLILSGKLTGRWTTTSAKSGYQEQDPSAQPAWSGMRGDGEKNYHLSTITATRADAWYERALKSVLREGQQTRLSTRESQDELAQPDAEYGSRHGTPEMYHGHGIHRTVETQVSNVDAAYADPSIEMRAVPRRDWI